MSVETAAELAAVGLAVWAAVLSIPRPPSLDWERLFKVALATLIRGEVEAAEGDLAAWEARLEAVPYHPAGRRGEDKLARPEPGALPVPALDGERALVEALAGLPDPVSRWEHMVRGDGRGLDVLLDDPATLGPDYDPARLLGPEVGWDAVAAWDETLVAALGRRLGHARIAGCGSLSWSEMSAAIGVPIEDLTEVSGAVGVPSPAEGDQGRELASALLGLTPDRADRLVVFAEGEHVFSVLVALRSSPELRDRVLAVVSLGGRIRDGARAAWLAEQFTHDRVDPELMRAIPYFAVIDVDPADPLARSWRDQRFPDPELPPSGRRAIEPIDLGPLPIEQLDLALLARALWVVVASRSAE